MTKKLPQRKPTRLRNYDYSQAGYYFITICTHNRKNLLSNIIVGEGLPLPQLTIQGEIANKYILLVSKKYPSVKIDKYIIMPNHIHIIMCIDNNGRGNPSPTTKDCVIPYNEELRHSLWREMR